METKIKHQLISFLDDNHMLTKEGKVIFESYSYAEVLNVLEEKILQTIEERELTDAYNKKYFEVQKGKIVQPRKKSLIYYNDEDEFIPDVCEDFILQKLNEPIFLPLVNWFAERNLYYEHNRQIVLDYYNSQPALPRWRGQGFYYNFEPEYLKDAKISAYQIKNIVL